MACGNTLYSIHQAAGLPTPRGMGISANGSSTIGGYTAYTPRWHDEKSKVTRI
jgi:hypothetical protein